MRTRRLEIFAFTAMVFAALALFASLQSSSRAEGGPGGSTAPASAAPAGLPAANAAPQAAQATVPNTFNYQGFLRNPDGTPMNGNYEIQIGFYDQASGGTNWAGAGWSPVPVRDGLFNVVMENTGDLFTAHSPLYIGVKVNGEPELIPRQRIHPVPWASLASTATTLVPGATVSNLNLTGTTKLGNADVATRGDNLLGLNSNGAGFLFTTGGAARMQVNSTDTIVYGRLSVVDSPVLIKRYNGNQCASNSPCLIPTGINISTHYCTMAGWEMGYDIQEIGGGVWSRWLYTDANGQWVLKISNFIQNNPIQVWAEITCFRSGIYTQQLGAASSAAAGANPTQSQAPALDVAPANTEN